MMFFKETYKNGQPHLCIVENQQIKASDAKNKFPIYESMLDDTRSNLATLRREFLKKMSARLDDRAYNRHAYILKSFLGDKERKPQDSRPPMRGRRIIRDTMRWGNSNLVVTRPDSSYRVHILSQVVTAPT